MRRSSHLSSATLERQSGRFEFVDALRGLAALGVVLPHAVGLFIYGHPSWLTELFLSLADFGRSSVEVFFVVSGFAIAYSLRDIESGGFTLGRFMLRRAVRLDPPYWVALVWNGLVVAIRARATHHAVVLPHPAKVLAHIFYAQDILGFGQFNVVCWTLCLEFQLYLVFAVLMSVASRFAAASRESPLRRWIDTDLYGWLMVAGFFVSLVLSHTTWPLRPGWFVPFFYLFLSGSLAAWRTLGRISDRLFQLCLCVMGVALLMRPELARALGFLTTLTLYAAIRRDTLHRWLVQRAPQWLGRISYSIYLVHAPLAVFFLGLRTRLAPESEIASLVLLLGLYLCTAALAALLHSVVEVPCLRLAQQLKRSVLRPGARVQEAPPA